MMTVAGYAATVDAPTGDPEDIARAQQDFGSSLYTVRCSREALASHRDQVPGLPNKGVYVLVGGLTADGTRRIYIGHARELGKRFDSHLRKKSFWTHCVFITSTHNVLHEGHIERVEALLIAQAKTLAGLDSSENSVTPADRSATNDVERAAATIIREFHLHLSILGMNYTRWGPPAVSQDPTRSSPEPEPVEQALEQESPSDDTADPPHDQGQGDQGGELPRDTLIVPAHEDGFKETFLGENCWYRIRIAEQTIPHIKYIAAYVTRPVRAITHYARVERIETYDDSGKKIVIFSGPAIKIGPINADPDRRVTIQGPRLAHSRSLFAANTVVDVFAGSSSAPEAGSTSTYPGTPHIRRYTLTARGVSATANVSPDGLAVQPGSQMARDATASISVGTRRQRQELIASGKVEERDDGLVFTQEVFFKRPSGAASVVLGRSSNGYDCWVDEHGKPLGHAMQPENFRRGTWIDQG